jgi:hypothetical protein
VIALPDEVRSSVAPRSTAMWQRIAWWMGISAVAIGSAGLDEHGNPYPLFVWSFLGYKNPVYIYSALVAIQCPHQRWGGR